MKKTKKTKKRGAKKKTQKTLTSLQKRFCDILLLMELSGKVEKRRAYELAGYKCRGETARVEADRTLRLPHVKKYLARARARREKVVEKIVEKTETEIIKEYEKMGFSDLASYYNDDGSLKKFSKLTKEQRAALKSITIEEQEYRNKRGKKGVYRKVKISLHTKKGSLDSLSKIKGMMAQDIMRTDNVNIFIDGEKVDGPTHKN